MNETVTISAQEYRRLQLVRNRAALCRTAQSRYFQSRSRTDLITAKSAEQLLDSVLRALEIGETDAADLFAIGETDAPANA